MFIRNSKIRNLILLACMVVLTANPASWATQAGRTSGSSSANMAQLVFVNADMSEFTDRMSKMLGLTPMLVDPTVQGSIDFDITIPRDLLFHLFNGILKSKNAALVKDNDNSFYQIVPIASAIRNGLNIIDDMPAGAGGQSPDISSVQPTPGQQREPEGSVKIPVATHVMRLDFMPVEDILDTVKLFVSEGAPIITFKRQNLIIITDYSDNVARVRELVGMLDNSFMEPNLIDLIKIENSNAVDIADELKKIFASSAADAAATGISFVPFERINAIFVTSGTKRGLDSVRRWIEELDTYDGNKYQTFVYTVKDSTASDIATMISALYSDDGSSSTSSSGRSSQGSSGSSSSAGSSSSLISRALDSFSESGGSFGSAQQLGPRLNASTHSVTSVILRGGPFSNLRDEVRIVVDESNNVLHIQSTLTDYRFLLSAIEKMDVPPRQVLIDAKIYEVILNNDLTYGFRGALEALKDDNMTTSGFLQKDSDDVLGGLSLNTFATVGSSRQISLAIEALKTRTKVKILEHPSVLAMDGNMASFVSGAEVPYPGDTIYTNSVSSQSVNYRETGVSLHVVPRISASGSVMLEISQEVSTVAVRSLGDLSAPIFPKTSVETVLSVKDGDTVAIAGLIRDTDSWGRTGIPFLSEIPFVGGLFGGTTKNKERTELIVLITPHVIKTPDRFQEISQGLRDSLRNVGKLADEFENSRIRDVEDARRYREKIELDNIREVKPVK